MSIDKHINHIPQLIQSRHINLHGTHLVGRFNNWLAVQITKKVGTMWCAYLFAVIGISAIVFTLTGSVTLALVAGSISSYFLQLVLLPVIIVGQNVIQAANDLRAEADHQTLTVLHSLNVQQLKILEILNEQKND